MAYTVLTTERPNVTADEVVIQLDGDIVAVTSGVPRWLPNNAGVVFEASGRWIEEDGTTKLSPHGDPVVTTMTHCADAISTATYGADVIARELLLALLGEPPEAMKDVLITGGPQFAPGQNIESITSSDVEPTKPILDLSPEVRLNASIRHAVASIKDLENLPTARNLLG